MTINQNDNFDSDYKFNFIALLSEKKNLKNDKKNDKYYFICECQKKKLKKENLKFYQKFINSLPIKFLF